MTARATYQSSAVQQLLRDVADAVNARDAVVICGEISTGRETVARVIHAATADRAGARSIDDLLADKTVRSAALDGFVAVDCAATNNVEEVIFGRAAAGPDGLEAITAEAALQRARGGTLFLRSVEETPARIQARLARVLRDREVWVVDGQAAGRFAVSARIIASMSATAPGDILVPELRRRLGSRRIDCPAVRERRDDLEAIIGQRFAEATAARALAKTLSAEALSLLCALPWRGNFAEVHAVVESVITATGAEPVVTVPDLLRHIRFAETDVHIAPSFTLKEARARFEREYVASVLRTHRGRMSAAASALGMRRTNLYRKVRQLAVNISQPLAELS